jgi:hypothetical protein
MTTGMGAGDKVGVMLSFELVDVYASKTGRQLQYGGDGVFATTVDSTHDGIESVDGGLQRM